MSVSLKCYRQIKYRLKQKWSIRRIARDVGVQEATVRDFKAGRKTSRTVIRSR